MSSNIPISNNAKTFQNLKNEPDLVQVLKVFEKSLRYGLNCVRVGIIESYNEYTQIAQINLVNKLMLSQNYDGSQVSKNYAPLFCKVWFFGWGDIRITHPVLNGQECIVLISDRELESWYINGGINPLKYTRSHDFSDGIAIVGLTSKVNIKENAKTSQNSLDLLYNLTSIILNDDGITNNGNTIINGNTTINGDVVFNGNLQVNGTISATGNITSNGDIIASGISLKNHVHGNGNQGNDTTAPK